MNNRLRIIGGHWRGRKIAFPDRQGLRPTPDRLRETLFNWLRLDVSHACCLDLFAGSGALGFEAASRGAARVVMVDVDSVVIKTLAAQVDRLGGSQIEVVQADYSRYLEKRPDTAPFDVVFIDPPFHRQLVTPACQLLESGWLKPGARIYVETETPVLSAIPSGWHLLKSGRTGCSHGFLLEHTGCSAEARYPTNGYMSLP